MTAHKAVAFFAGELDALPLPDGTVVCPDDDGSQVVATLTYPQSRSVAVSVGLRGCETATNGTVSRTASGFGSPPEKAPPLVDQLERILPPGSADGQRFPGTALAGDRAFSGTQYADGMTRLSL
ncbi:MAG: hypothetical protein WB761_06760 [Solirubrobacteraceae bacterium]